MQYTCINSFKSLNGKRYHFKSEISRSEWLTLTALDRLCFTRIDQVKEDQWNENEGDQVKLNFEDDSEG